MNKALSILLCCLFTIFSLSSLGGIAFGQGNGKPGSTPKSTNTVNGDTEIGINFGNNCLTGMGKGCFDYEKMIGIDKEQDKRITTTTVAQDVLLAATYMVGTVLSIVIIYCGFMYIIAARNGKVDSKYKTGLINAGIGAIIVRGAYAIVRLIQYIAKG